MPTLAFVRAALLPGLVALAFLGCTGEARIVPAPGAGGAASGGTAFDDAGSGDGGSGDGGRSTGGKANGGTSTGGGASSGGTGAGGRSGGGAGGVPPPRDGGPPACGPTVSSGNSSCDGCASSACPTELAACEADEGCRCQASCILHCPTLTGRVQEQNACAANCQPTSMLPKVSALIQCLAPPAVMPPTCAPCFHPPPP